MVKRNVVVLYSDASVYANGQPGLQDCSYAVVLEDGTDDGLLLRHIQVGDASVNEGEYRGVIGALQWLADEQLDRCAVIITDSQLVFGHVVLDWRCKLPTLRFLRDRVRALLLATEAQLLWKPRGENKAGHFFEALVEQRRKMKYRARKSIKRAKRKTVRSLTLDARALGKSIPDAVRDGDISIEGTHETRQGIANVA